MSGTITLIGAGELMAAGSGLHRAALARVEGLPRAVFLDTTAGFETNVEAIDRKAQEYYGHHLQTALEVVRYRHAQRTTAAETATAVSAIRRANLIFAGPGSPTYFLTQLRDSPVWEAVVEQWEAGAHLVFASAAAITVGRYSLPVYEIYKAGADPFWAEGLDLLGRLGLKATIVPHFNDSSGGQNYDSRFCYQGAARFDRLQELLPADVSIIGIDAYTALILEAGGGGTVVGQGGITVIGEKAQARYEAGERVPLAAWQTAAGRVRWTANEAPVYRGYEFTDAPGSEPSFEAVASYIQSLSRVDERQHVELIARVRALCERARSDPSPHEAALVDLVLQLRDALRAQGRYDMADGARQALAEMGFVISDSTQGSSWTRR